MSKLLSTNGTPLTGGNALDQAKIDADRERQAAYLAQMANMVLAGEVIAFGFVGINKDHASQHNAWGSNQVYTLELFGALMNLATSYHGAVLVQRPTSQGGSA